MVDFNIQIGGAAGQGVQRAGFLLGKVFVRGGYHVFAIQDAESRIRGGHNFFKLRISDKPIAAMTEGADLMIALDRETVELDFPQLRENGLLILDGDALKISVDHVRMTDLPMRKLALEHGGKPIFANTVALGFVLGLLEYPLGPLAQLFGENFPQGDLAAVNERVAAVGRDLAMDQSNKCTVSLKPVPTSRRMFIQGNDAIALGALAADVKFMSAYPMSPSTTIITYLAGHEEQTGVVTEQAEDEIAAINLAFGASMAGVRAMTATSGGGMALMTETISLLGSTEVPLVIVNTQRPGPATGLPTRTEQGDLFFSIYAGHGEFPKVVLAPGNAEQAFFDTVRAFNLADTLQVPVILLAEQHLSESYYTVDPFDLEKVERRTSLLDAATLDEMGEYKRYQQTQSGVSPRAYPGQSRQLVLTDSHEHTETGHPTEDQGVRRQIVEKRRNKTKSVLEALQPPERFGSADAGLVILGWGSTRGVLIEAVTRMQAEGEDVALLYFTDLWPFSAEATREALRAKPRLISVEGNATGQLAQLVCQHTDQQQIETVLHYDGRPLIVDEIIAEIKEKVTQ